VFHDALKVWTFKKISLLRLFVGNMSLLLSVKPIKLCLALLSRVGLAARDEQLIFQTSSVLL